MLKQGAFRKKLSKFYPQSLRDSEQLLLLTWKVKGTAAQQPEGQKQEADCQTCAAQPAHAACPRLQAPEWGKASTPTAQKPCWALG